MTPQQATADQATTEVMQHFVANISGLELREKIKHTIIKAMECRAPAPTEPAVDRDAVLREADQTCRLVAWEYANEGDGEREAGAEACRNAIQGLLATPASPAVPEPAPLAPNLVDVIEGIAHQGLVDLQARFPDDNAAQLRHIRASIDSVVAAMKADFATAPQVAQASQPTSAEELQQDKLMPPVAAPVSQQDACFPVLTDERITEISRAFRNASGLVLMDLSFARAIEAELTSRCRKGNK